LDPLAHGNNVWHEGYKHPYYLGQENVYTTLYSQEKYLLDSGATCHVTNSAENLEDLRTEKTKIVVGENLTCAAQMSGTLHLKFDTHVEGTNLLSLERVFMVSMFNKKVISIPLLIKKGYNFVFKVGICLILAPDQRCLQVQGAEDGLFHITIIRHRQMRPHKRTLG